MASSAPHNNPSQRQRSDIALTPPPISSYAAYRGESLQRNDSPLTPYSDSPSFESQSRNGGHDRRFYGVGGGGRINDSGGFGEDIPLRPRSEQNAPGSESPQHDGSGGDKALPPPAGHRRRKRRREPERKKGIKGFFQGKVPWVVYIFTLVQVTVFIVEIVKNCTLCNLTSGGKR
jgi:hypothetical protein